MDLFWKIGKIGPQNAAVLDLDKGKIEKNNSQILVVDEKLVNSINWIKEGSFDEKEGERTLKLVGQVQAIDAIEIIKKEQTDKLKDYPLSATELADAIRARETNIKKNEIWKIIIENDIKNNLDYSTYNYRNKKQEETAKSSGIVPQGIPSIYKEATIDYIIKIYKSELDIKH
ncbi:MAG: hypothetical protein MJ204_03195 [Bacteroidales bacterium]|nr:hypothetical protein [Bacteroidales bacterium]